MCGYWHGGTIECRGDGYMWDADCDGYDPEDHSFPCPACNTREYLLTARENGEGCSYSSGLDGDYTGEDMWLGGVKVAMRANPNGTPRILRQVGIARPIIDHPTDRAAFIEKFHDHRNERRLVSRNKREGHYAGKTHYQHKTGLWCRAVSHLRTREAGWTLRFRAPATNGTASQESAPARNDDDCCDGECPVCMGEVAG